jgi:4-carboxymuconolactone decarboxylase
MSRIPEISSQEMTAEQKRIHNEIASGRSGNVRGPFAIWLRLPDLADKANQLGNTLRLHGNLEKRLFELIVLVTARHWTAPYEWIIHEDVAIKAGLAREVVEAIRAHQRPAFVRDDEELVYDAVMEIYETRRLSQATYDRALALLGLDLLIEMVAAAGFYTMVAITLNAFDVPVPGGKAPLTP